MEHEKTMERSAFLDNNARNYLPGGVHYNFRESWDALNIYFQKGKGSRIWDADGNEYLDFFCKFGANILGHCDSRYTDALTEAISYATAVNHSVLEEQVCKMVCDLVPCADMVRFCLSGTEAVQNALRLARAYTGRNKFIKFVGHFHGNADNVLGGSVAGNEPYSVLDNPRTETKGRARGILSDQLFLIQWNDFDALERLVNDFGDDIAAILMEPICINDNGIYPQPGYLQKVRTLCDEKGIVLIFDEVITGFRVGLHGAQGELGITPDLTTLGKAIAGGTVPVSAVAGKRDIMRLYENRSVVHGGTFNGYALGLAAVKATLSILSEDNGSIYQKMNKKMKEMHAIIENQAAVNGLNIKVQGPATCGCIVKVNTHGYKNILYSIALNAAFLENGVLLSNRNMYSNIHVGDADVEKIEKVAGKVFRRVAGDIKI